MCGAGMSLGGRWFAAPLLGFALALALTQAQAQGAVDPLAQDDGRLPGFRSVPLGPDGAPLEYAPPRAVAPDLVEARSARLRLLDKMTGLVRTLEMAPGETLRAERLELALRSCRVPAADTRQDAVAYLEIRDLREAVPRFAGWMFASSPALSALDHARYDVWVLSCSTSSGPASADSE